MTRALHIHGIHGAGRAVVHTAAIVATGLAVVLGVLVVLIALYVGLALIATGSLQWQAAGTGALALAGLAVALYFVRALK
jgi:hypothetical protein